jgi:putative Mn2+ efflux pump MntP
MPLLGWLLMHLVGEEAIRQVDHWIAFCLLAFIGGKMIFSAFSEEKERPALDVTSWKARHLLAVATSIDALAVGITFACTGYVRLGQLTVPLLVIGLVSFALSVAGFTIGTRSGEAVNKKIRPELLGGVILVGIGVKILLEHLLAG